ncbi:hypothetical protein SMICM304S_08584 [Streptomyces microflavus]
MQVDQGVGVPRAALGEPHAPGVQEALPDAALPEVRLIRTPTRAGWAGGRRAPPPTPEDGELAAAVPEEVEDVAGRARSRPSGGRGRAPCSRGSPREPARPDLLRAVLGEEEDLVPAAMLARNYGRRLARSVPVGPRVRPRQGGRSERALAMPVWAEGPSLLDRYGGPRAFGGTASGHARRGRADLSGGGRRGRAQPSATAVISGPRPRRYAGSGLQPAVRHRGVRGAEEGRGRRDRLRAEAFAAFAGWAAGTGRAAWRCACRWRRHGPMSSEDPAADAAVRADRPHTLHLCLHPCLRLRQRGFLPVRAPSAPSSPRVSRAG